MWFWYVIFDDGSNVKWFDNRDAAMDFYCLEPTAEYPFSKMAGDPATIAEIETDIAITSLAERLRGKDKLLAVQEPRRRFRPAA